MCQWYRQADQPFGRMLLVVCQCAVCSVCILFMAECELLFSGLNVAAYLILFS